MTSRNKERLAAAREVGNQRAARWFGPRQSFATRPAIGFVILVTLTLARLLNHAAIVHELWNLLATGGDGGNGRTPGMNVTITDKGGAA